MFLAHQAWLMGDAIVRTLCRLFVTPPASARMGYRPRRRRIGPRLDLLGFYRRMAGALVIGALAHDRRSGVAAAEHGRWPLPFARAVARLAGRGALGQPAAAGRRPTCRCRTADAQALRLTARRTWRFFETFVTAADHMLPPDNFQEDPTPGRWRIAPRRPISASICCPWRAPATSAGSESAETVERLEATLATMSAAGALPRPFLQLVRHAGSAPARSEIRLLRR